MTRNMTIRKHSQNRGFSLVELMIGLVVGLFVIGVIVTVFVQSKRNYNQDEQVALMQENGRYVLQLLNREIAHAGFLGGMSAIDTVSADTSASFSNDCADWFSPVSSPIEVYTATAANLKNCFDGETVKSGTEVIVIKRTAGKETTSLSANKLYFATTGQGGKIFKSTSTTPPAAYTDTGSVDWQYWEYYVEIYYIEDEDSDGDGESTPGLFRKRLIVSSGNITVTNDGLLAPGVRDFGVLYGIDSTEDGIANTYTVATSFAGDYSKIVSARVSVLAMSTDTDPNNDNTKQYSLYPSVSAAADVGGLTDSNYYGRAFSTTTQVRNNAYRIQIFSLTK